MAGENVVCGEAKETCLCYPLLPYVHGVGLGEVGPAHSVLRRHYETERP